MTIDAGLKPEGAPERSPIAGAGAPRGVDAGPKRYSGQRKDGGGGVFVAWRTVGCRRPGSRSLCGQADRMAGSSAGRRGVSPGRNASATIARMKSPDCNPRWARSPWTTNCCPPKIAAIEAKSPLARRRSRR